MWLFVSELKNFNVSQFLTLLFATSYSRRIDLNSAVLLFCNGLEASSRNHGLINLEGRQEDKRGTTNCRYRAGAILHEHLSPKEVLGCASRRKVERRDLKDEARCLLGTSSSLSFFFSRVASRGIERKMKRMKDRKSVV